MQQGSGMAEWDNTTKATVAKIPLLATKAGPRDKEEWQKRLKEVGAGGVGGGRGVAGGRRSTPRTAQVHRHPPPAHLLLLVQELQALIKYIELNKGSDLDWFTIKPVNKEGTRWEGVCWYVHDLIKYDFNFQVGGSECVGWGVCVGGGGGGLGVRASKRAAGVFARA